MPGKFEHLGLQFLYPENWAVERDDTEGGWSVTVQSPQTAFLTISVNEDDIPPDELSDTALEALIEEYPELESDGAMSTIAQSPAVGYDISFYSFDLTNIGEIRAFPTDRGSVLVWWQANDMEEQNEQVLRAIVASLTVEGD